MMRVAVYVESIVKTHPGPKVTVTAVNNGHNPGGPPMVTWVLNPMESSANVHIGKRYWLTVEEAE